MAAAAGGLHIITRVDEIGTPVVLHDEHGPVHFYGIPFLDPKIDRGHFGDDTLVSHEPDPGRRDEQGARRLGGLATTARSCSRTVPPPGERATADRR